MINAVPFERYPASSIFANRTYRQLFDPANPLARFSYKEMMEIYIAEGDDVLKAYLDSRRQEDTLSKDEEDYWNFAMNNGMTKEIFRRKIVEMHTEDRKKDPLEVKIGRAVARASYGIFLLESPPNSRENQGIDENLILFTKEDIIKLTVMIKNVLLEKFAGNKNDVKTILDDKEEIINAQSEKIIKTLESMQKVIPNRVNDDNPHYISTELLSPFVAKHLLVVRDYYEKIMPQYVDRYMEAKRKGQEEGVIPTRRKANTIPLSMRDIGDFLSQDRMSETTTLKGIAEITGLSKEETQQLIDEFYFRSSFSDELRGRIAEAFRENPEEKLIKVLRKIHVSWNIWQSNKFQMWNEKQGHARNREHQFDDLLLMQYGKDGAMADKFFVDPILRDLGIEVDEAILRKTFIAKQENFLSEIASKYGKGKDIHQALIAYLKSGEYIAGCESIAGKTLMTPATAIKYDPSRATHPEKWSSMPEIPIGTLIREDDKVAESMATLIEDQIRANGIDLNSFGEPEGASQVTDDYRE